MTSEILLASGISLGLGSIVGYLIGYNHKQLIDRIRTLEGQKREVPPEPEKPTVTGGAYQPPKEISNTIEKQHKAGLVESKTPQQMDWEAQEELRKLEHSA